MGRQIPLVATLEDERAFLAFLRSTAPLRIFQSFARTTDELWVDDFANEFQGHIGYKIWNTTFPWEPTYRQVGPHAHDPSLVGWYYVSNTATAPVLEFDRSSGSGPGRLYWARHFAAPDGLTYDDVAFSKWVDRAFRWVRKVGLRLTRDPYSDSYWLPAALRDAGLAAPET